MTTNCSQQWRKTEFVFSRSTCEGMQHAYQTGGIAEWGQLL